ncbi:methyltransferase domain-containing protein [Cyanobium sp. NIES-981]|uniref:methyltransferase domain-containing protein n=1 Tax=Cyanobium sp. NIES-981 TaxID=1851505 RepID=UPI000B350CFE|nr:methyltransferase domain-containing protein [Cyanobium sp. NIES-981]
MERLNLSASAGSGNSVEASIHVARYMLAEKLCRGKSVLDVACGEGYGAWLMAEKWGAKHVLGVDYSSEAIHEANSHFNSSKLHYLQHCAESLIELRDYGPFDLIVSIETIEHVKDVDTFLDGVKSLMADDGIFICTAPNDEWYYGAGESTNPYHLRTFTYGSFQDLLNSRFPQVSYGVGTKALGFTNVYLDKQHRQEVSLLNQICQAEAMASVMITPGSESKVNPSTTAYFFGIAGHHHEHNSSALYPAPLSSHLSIPSACSQSIAKPKIALIADRPGWAFDNIAKNIQRHSGNNCSVDIHYLINYPSYAAMYREFFGDVLHYDLFHFFWRPSLFALFEPENLYAAAQDLPDKDRDFFLWNTAMATKTTSVYDHLFLRDDPQDTTMRSFMPLADSYSTCSQKLADIYASVDFISPPSQVITDGIDLQIFKPHRIERLQEDGSKREVVIGWAGNSNWRGPNNEHEQDDHKGLRSVIIPAVERLRQEGVSARGQYQDREVNWIEHHLMPDYYGQIDIYVNASLHEGTPNPVLEAMASGLPVLTTDVGVVRELFGPLQSRYIVQDRNSPEFYAKLKELATSPELRSQLSAENLQSIQPWSWNVKARDWLAFFSHAIDARLESSRPHEQYCVLRHLWNQASRQHQDAIERQHLCAAIETLQRELQRECEAKGLLLEGSQTLIKSMGQLLERQRSCLSRSLHHQKHATDVPPEARLDHL